MSLSTTIIWAASPLQTVFQGLVFVTLLASGAAIPSVFLSDKLWTSGVVTVLAAFLLWQAWTREQAIRNETHEREKRMAERVDRLEAQHHEDMKQMIVAVQILETVPHDIRQLEERIIENCKACDERRTDIIGTLNELKKG